MKLLARNAYEIADGVVRLDLVTGGNFGPASKTRPIRYALLDEEDLPLVCAVRWVAKEKDGYTYAIGNLPAPLGGGTVAMHRLVVGVNHSRIYVDHANHDGLDNRRANLRICSQTENQRNKAKKGGTSRFLGVSFQHGRPKLQRRWRATISHEGKTICLGYFRSEEEAARARDIAASELFGEFANLNFREAS